MSYTYKITSAAKAHHVADNTDFLDVAYDIYDDKGDKVAEFKNGFPVGTLEDPIREELQRKADWCEATDIQRVANAGQIAADEATNATVGALMADVEPQKKSKK